jgi:hypothetical protein
MQHEWFSRSSLSCFKYNVLCFTQKQKLKQCHTIFIRYRIYQNILFTIFIFNYYAYIIIRGISISVANIKPWNQEFNDYLSPYRCALTIYYRWFTHLHMHENTKYMFFHKTRKLVFTIVKDFTAYLRIPIVCLLGIM